MQTAVEVLNVAGPRASKEPGIASFVILYPRRRLRICPILGMTLGATRTKVSLFRDCREHHHRPAAPHVASPGKNGCEIIANRDLEASASFNDREDGMALGRRNGIHVGSRQAGPQSLTLSRILDEMHRNPDWGINEAVLSCQNRYKYLIALLKTNPEQLCISNFFPHPEVEVNTTLLVRLTLSKGSRPPRNNNGDLSRSWPKPLRDCGHYGIVFGSTRKPKKKRQLS